MKLYFSGVASKAETEMLKGAKIRDWLADTTDWQNLHIDDVTSGVLDSGAYRAWKSGNPIEVDGWLETVNQLDLQCIGWLGTRRIEPRLDFVIMPDVLGDHEATWARWDNLCDRRLDLLDRGYWWFDKVVPVWQWGAPAEHLEKMIEWAIRGEECVKEYGFRWANLVCVGGLVPHFRDNNGEVLAEVVKVCEKHGKYLHILGLNWLKAMDELDPLVRSCDTSKWLDGARYGEVIYCDENTGKLVQIHHKMHELYSTAGREERSIACAKNLDDYVNKGIRQAP
jgi:hypothetical protein